MAHHAPIIQFERVSYQVDQVAILRNIDLAVMQGEVLVLLGESGCGKTTTLRLINRLIDPSSGKIFIEGKATTDWDAIELRRRVGYVIQEAGLFPHMTVSQNIGIVLRLLGRSKDEIEFRSVEMLELVKLSSDRFADRYPHELSGGQRQRVGVARALAADPKIILLDEPFGALDAITRISLQKEFSRLVRDLGKTAVFVTHDLREAMLLGTRIALMDKGDIVLVDTPDNFARSGHPLVSAYMETIAVGA